jgi:E3 ubiquitin-protein ligase BRE1
MPAIEATPVASSESGIVKMEDRKRPATHDHTDSAPPLKKQATSVNGGSRPHPDADMPWKDDLDVSYQNPFMEPQRVAGGFLWSTQNAAEV